MGIGWNHLIPGEPLAPIEGNPGAQASLDALRAAGGAAPIQSQGTAQASQHTVSASGDGKNKAVQDGAHGEHDYGVDLHPEVVSRFKAHGARLKEHSARIERLEGAMKANLGSPQHHTGGK